MIPIVQLELNNELLSALTSANFSTVESLKDYFSLNNACPLSNFLNDFSRSWDIELANALEKYEATHKEEKTKPVITLDGDEEFLRKYQLLPEKKKAEIQAHLNKLLA